MPELLNKFNKRSITLLLWKLYGRVSKGTKIILTKKNKVKVFILANFRTQLQSIRNQDSVVLPKDRAMEWN
jgi:hypothetical protein